MNNSSKQIQLFCGLLLITIALACTNSGGADDPHKVNSASAMKSRVSELVAADLQKAIANNGQVRDSLNLIEPALAASLYATNEGNPLWSKENSLLPEGELLQSFIQGADNYGLFPEDYHSSGLKKINDLFLADTAAIGARKDATLWAQAEILLTDAFVQLIHDVKLGRLPNDSLSLRADSVLTPEFYAQQLTLVKKDKAIQPMVESLEPTLEGYQQLKAGLKGFLNDLDFRTYTYVPSPAKDSLHFSKLLHKRLFEGGFISFDHPQADSVQLSKAIRQFQKQKGLEADGKLGAVTLRTLNMTDKEKFLRVAISMDKYKQLPEKMPAKYVWVNIPSYYLEVIQNDTMLFTSKVICGKAKTRTPLLNSAISTIITYPQWVPPPSIVSKEILPAVKRNPGYLARKGFSLVNNKGERVDPYSVNWSKYSKGIPYRVVQGSGDANSLGIMKFHFENPYSVYLHDTNQRYLFGATNRSLSHGCVRVQEWEKLAFYIIANDSMLNNKNARIDSVKSWLDSKKKKNVVIKNSMPVYIRYITCEGKNGKLLFYDDPYEEDQFIREKYFAGK